METEEFKFSYNDLNQKRIIEIFQQMEDLKETWKQLWDLSKNDNKAAIDCLFLEMEQILSIKTSLLKAISENSDILKSHE